MSDSESDCDELFYYAGRKNIQEKCIIWCKKSVLDEEKLKEKMPAPSITIEPIFVSDEDMDDELLPQEQSDKEISKDEAIPTRVKFNTEEFIAEIDKKSKIRAMKEMKKHKSQSEATYYCLLVVTCRKMQHAVKQLSKTLNKDRLKQERRKKLIQSLKKKQISQTVPVEEKSENVWLLKGEEKEKALRNDFEEQEDVVYLVLRILEKEEERREAIRMNRVVSDMGCHLESTVNRDPKDTARMRLQRSKSDI